MDKEKCRCCLYLYRDVDDGCGCCSGGQAEHNQVSFNRLRSSSFSSFFWHLVIFISARVLLNIHQENRLLALMTARKWETVIETACRLHSSLLVEFDCCTPGFRTNRLAVRQACSIVFGFAFLIVFIRLLGYDSSPSSFLIDGTRACVTRRSDWLLRFGHVSGDI